MREQHVRHRDRAVAALAAEEWGVLSGAELFACGLDRSAIARRVRSGRLHPMHRQVYAVGHPNVPLPGRFLAAVKACGSGAVLSHFAAAAHAEMMRWDEDWPIDVTVLGVGTRRHHGLRIHRTEWLDPRDVMIRDGIRVTAPWRTALDLAAHLPERRLRRLVRQALAEGTLNLRRLADVLARGRGRRGCRRLARVLTHAQPTRSELEDVVLDLIVSGGFEPPDVNRPLRVEGHTLIPDFRWPDQRLIVEADGRKWHDDPLARADDAKRQAVLERSGERVERVTWTQAVSERLVTQARLRSAGAPDRRRTRE